MVIHFLPIIGRELLSCNNDARRTDRMDPLEVRLLNTATIPLYDHQLIGSHFLLNQRELIELISADCLRFINLYVVSRYLYASKFNQNQ